VKAQSLQLAQEREALREQVAERQRAEDALQLARQELETRVQERTRDLFQANESLKETEKRFRSLIENSFEAIALLSAEGTILYSSPATSRVSGYATDEFVGRSAFALLHPDDVPGVQKLFADLLQMPGGSLTTQARSRNKDGSWHWVESTGTNLLADPAVQAIVVNYRDITERKQAEAALLESHHFLRSVVEGTTDAVFAKDREGRYQMINSAVVRLLGRPAEEVIGQDDTALFPGETAQRIMADDRRIMASLTPETFEQTLAPSGVPRILLTTKGPWRDAAGNLLGIIGIGRDITDRKRLQDQLQETQKLESIGRLAAGVAHEFNNQLTVIQGYSALFMEKLDPKDPLREFIEVINRAAERSSAVTQQLLAFSRKQVRHPKVLNLNLVMHGIATLLRPLIGEDISLRQDLDPGLDRVSADQGQIEQVVMNLAVNARDAMPAGGTLTLATRNVELDAAGPCRDPDIQPGPYVMLSVADTGCGMDDETRTHVFEPFFTTKEVGKGTGLGLAMVYGIIKQNGGFIEVDSEPGRGSVFRIYLPRMPAIFPLRKSDPGVVRRPQGIETVLVVEDEDEVRFLISLVLAESGYAVVEARNGAEALQKIQQHPGPLPLVITDVVMPQMNGPELVAQLRKLSPQMKILYLSGYPREEAVQRGVLEDEAGFLQKPFHPVALAKSVREVLDQSG
jgi:PAS domain S-box-containing protein